MGNEDYGESSSKQESEEGNRPLKKAKYIWQVKGKYHLKATCQNTEKDPKTEESITARRRSSTGDVCDVDTGCVDKFLARTDAILDSDEDDPSNFDKSIHSEIPVTLVTPNPKNVEYYLQKWQARQIARSYIDNTINSVLETWVSVPFNAEDFVDNCDFDSRIEDKGILMAIESHGLHSMDNEAYQERAPTWAFVKPHELADDTLDKYDTVRPQIIGDDIGWELADEKENSPTVEKKDMETQADLEAVYPVDILNAAILVAIEKKGLSKNLTNK